MTKPLIVLVLFLFAIVAEGKTLLDERDIKAFVKSDWAAVQSQHELYPDTPQSIDWDYRVTPGFPVAWPPQGSVVLVYYGYPYGFSFNLRNGEHIGQPWVRVEVAPDRDPVKTVLLYNIIKMGIQGVRPLDSKDVQIAENGLLAQDYLGTLTELPAEQNRKTPMMRDYYCFWLRTHSIIGGLLRKQHSDFIKWLQCKDK